MMIVGHYTPAQRSRLEVVYEVLEYLLRGSEFELSMPDAGAEVETFRAIDNYTEAVATEAIQSWSDSGVGRIIARRLYARLHPNQLPPDAVICKGCDAPVVWARHRKTGKPAPINARPSDDGNVILDVLTYWIASVAERKRMPELLHTSHFANCPAAESFRKNRP